MRKRLRNKILTYVGGLAAVISGLGMFLTNEDWSRQGYYGDYPWAWGLASFLLGLLILVMAWRKEGPPWRSRNRNRDWD